LAKASFLAKRFQRSISVVPAFLLTRTSSGKILAPKHFGQNSICSWLAITQLAIGVLCRESWPLYVNKRKWVFLFQEYKKKALPTQFYLAEKNPLLQQ
jgi:hypothetical protein